MRILIFINSSRICLYGIPEQENSYQIILNVSKMYQYLKLWVLPFKMGSYSKIVNNNYTMENFLTPIGVAALVKWFINMQWKKFINQNTLK